MDASPDDVRDESVLVDPSVLFTDRGMAWIADADVRQRVLISNAFRIALDYDYLGQRLAGFVDEADPDPLEERIGQLRGLLDGIATVSSEGVGLSTEDSAVLEVLRTENWEGDILADEFTYMLTHSFMVAATRHTLNAFSRAGAVVIRVGQRFGSRWTRQVISPESLPRLIADGTANRRAGIKFIVNAIVAGGAVAATPIPPLAIALGIGTTLLPTAFQEIDP